MSSSVSAPKVTVLAIQHEYGSTVEAYASYELAEAALYSWVKEYWSQVGDLPIPEDRKEAIELYFESSQDESYDLEEVSVQGA